MKPLASAPSTYVPSPLLPASTSLEVHEAPTFFPHSHLLLEFWKHSFILEYEGLICAKLFFWLLYLILTYYLESSVYKERSPTSAKKMGTNGGISGKQMRSLGEVTKVPALGNTSAALLTHVTGVDQALLLIPERLS